MRSSFTQRYHQDALRSSSSSWKFWNVSISSILWGINAEKQTALPETGFNEWVCHVESCGSRLRSWPVFADVIKFVFLRLLALKTLCLCRPASRESRVFSVMWSVLGSSEVRRKNRKSNQTFRPAAPASLRDVNQTMRRWLQASSNGWSLLWSHLMRQYQI